MALPIIGGILSLGTTLIERLIPDKEAQAQAKLKLLEMDLQGDLHELQAQAGIITTEAKSEHWLTATWRPITMLTFVVIIANNYILYPYLSLFWDSAPALEIPPDMWDLLKLGLGGYVMGRSAEKGIKLWREKG